MQISEAWLRSFVNPPVSTEQLVAQLTMAGLEVDSVTPASAQFQGVVVGEVLAMEPHPDADRLRVCKVAVGDKEPLQIVCGASNVRVGLKIPTALCSAVLPGDFKIKRSKLRGVESFGMLCSEKELGLAADANGLMELAANAPVGVDIRDYLNLNDTIIEVDLTPNRADCLSVEGIAREVAVLNQMDWSPRAVEAMPITYSQSLSVTVSEPEACPRYLGRLIENVNAKAETPLWMQERLRRSGIRSLGAIVDVTNYVLLELGQPLHAFDADKLRGTIHVRSAKTAEKIALLNGQLLELNTDTLVIADEHQALALAGIMGGSETAVSDKTQAIFLECAFFAPRSLAGKARHYGLHTDSSHRFERGVDPSLQWRALERATQLIIEIAGGNVGVITEVRHDAALPQRTPVHLRKQRLEKLLGVVIADETVSDIFKRLGMSVVTHADSWQVTPPGCRFDIAIEADLVEEIARIYGYNNLPNTRIAMRSELSQATESRLEINRVADLLVDRGYQEVITYSFVDEEIQKAIAPEDTTIRLSNPISSELSVMRTTLWGGLLKAALHNINRQQVRVRFFETGMRFIQKDNELCQQKMLAGLILGSPLPEQWGEGLRKVDFFDMKADVEALFALTGKTATFLAANHGALHPGQTAQILSGENELIGWMGMLHPTLEKQLGFDTPVFLFELEQALLLNKQLPSFKPLSKYPSVRRDLALVVKEEITAMELITCINSCHEASIKNTVIFDVYRGKGIEEDYKSMALSLHLQNEQQTLTESEIDATLNRVLEILNQQISARLRD